MKKITKRLFAIILAAFFVVTLMPAVSYNKKVDAATANVYATTATTDSITIKWAKQSDAVKYYIGYGSSYTKASEMAEAKKYPVSSSTDTYTIKNLKAGTNYCIYVKYATKSSTYVWSVGSTNAGTIGKKISVFDLDSYSSPASGTGKASFEVDWKRIESADGYQYEVYSNGGTKLTTQTTSSNYFYYTEAKHNATYKIRVRSYVEINSKKKYSEWSAYYYVISQPYISSAKINSKNQLSLKWEKVSGATSYEIWVSSSNGIIGYQKLATTTGTSKQIAKIDGKAFSKSKYYYVIIRAVKKVGSTNRYSGSSYYTTIK